MHNPSICNVNTSFLIDKSYFTHEKDILCDLRGHWKLSKTKRFKFCIDKSTLFKVAVSGTRSLYQQQFCKDFHKVLISIDGNSFVCLPYFFDCEERSIVAKEPHGDAKKEMAFIRTKPYVLVKIRNSEKLPKTIVSNILQECGGSNGVQGHNNLVRNRQQIYNAKLRAKEQKDEEVEVMDLYKREQNSQLHFIPEVNLELEMSVFVFTEQQLIDIEHFCTIMPHFCVLGFDATYNIGSYLCHYFNVQIFNILYKRRYSSRAHGAIFDSHR